MSVLRVLLARPQAQAERTARRLALAGHEAIVAPVLSIVPTGAPAPQGRFDAVVGTSVQAFSIGALPRDWLTWPAFAVGPRTADAARSAGFRDVRTATGGGADLAALIALTLPSPSRLLYLAGRDRKPALEGLLGDRGDHLFVHERYEARPSDPWRDDIVERLRNGTIDAALHFSRRSAELALAQARAGRAESEFLALGHYCLSDDAAAPLHDVMAGIVAVAPSPDEDSLLSLLRDGRLVSARL